MSSGVDRVSDYRNESYRQVVEEPRRTTVTRTEVIEQPREIRTSNVVNVERASALEKTNSVETRKTYVKQ